MRPNLAHVAPHNYADVIWVNVRGGAGALINLEEKFIIGSGLERGAVSLDSFQDDDLRLLARLHERGQVKLVGSPGSTPYVVFVRDAG